MRTSASVRARRRLGRSVIARWRGGVANPSRRTRPKNSVPERLRGCLARGRVAADALAGRAWVTFRLASNGVESSMVWMCLSSQVGTVARWTLFMTLSVKTRTGPVGLDSWCLLWFWRLQPRASG
jgi:hypothetical protein